jgi:hypothetical protein
MLLSDYPAVEAFAEYLRLSRAVQAHAVYPELDRLLNALGEAMARSELERQWWRARQAQRLLADAVSTELTRSQWRDYRAASLAPQALAAFCAEQGQPIAADTAPLVSLQPLIARFYALAEQRDQALVSNTLAWLTNAGQGTRDRGRSANDQRRTTNDLTILHEPYYTCTGAPSSFSSSTERSLPRRGRAQSKGAGCE